MPPDPHPTSRAVQNGQRWPKRPAIRARYDAAAREAGYSDLEELLADTGLSGLEAGRVLGISGQTVGIMRRQRSIAARRQPATARSQPTMPEAPNPAVALLRLRRLLRRARDAVGMTQAETAIELGWSRSKALRIESGEVRPSPTDVRALLDLYGARDQLEEADRLARAAKRSTWTSEYWDVLSAGDRACFDLEPSATVIDTFAFFVLPGLLQTEEYTRAVAPVRPDADRAGRYVEVCVRRQQLLVDPPSLRFYVDEAVLRRGAVGEKGAAQMAHLLKLAEHPKITIRVVPLDAGIGHLCTSFTMLELADPPETLLYLEDLPRHGGLVREEDPGRVAHRRDVLEWCDVNALPADTLAEVVEDALQRHPAQVGARHDQMLTSRPA